MNNILRSLSIKNKLLLVFVVLTSIVLVVVLSIAVSFYVTSAKNNIAAVNDVVGSIIAERSVTALVFDDGESANSNLATLAAHKSVAYACIMSSDNRMVAEYIAVTDKNFVCQSFVSSESNRYEKNYHYSTKPIKLDNVVIGIVEIVVNLDELREGVIRISQNSILIFIIMIILASIIAMRLLNMITDPVMHIKDVAQRITSSKDYSIRINKMYGGEVGVLIVAINNMLGQIQSRDEELQVLNETLEKKVVERTSELQALNERIGVIARSAGMAEVASGVLHNVGNVLNSVNVSVSMIKNNIRKSKINNLGKVVEMMEEHAGDIETFMLEDEKGRQVPAFLKLLSEQMLIENREISLEVSELSDNLDHIKNVISMQQSYAGSYGVKERLNLKDLVEDALKISMEGVSDKEIELVKNYDTIPDLYIDKHKVLQIIINIISNARHAVVESKSSEKKITISMVKVNNDIHLVVKDTGVGIEESDVSKLFQYGFKKRKDGHGYGLHHSALVANELGGKIRVESEGLGKGASFSLVLPLIESEVN